MTSRHGRLGRLRALAAGGLAVWVAGNLGGPALHTAFHDRPHEHTPVGIRFLDAATSDHAHPHPHDHVLDPVLAPHDEAFPRGGAPYAPGRASGPDRHLHAGGHDHPHDPKDEDTTPSSGDPFHGVTSIAHFASFVAAHPVVVVCFAVVEDTVGTVIAPVANPPARLAAARARPRAPPFRILPIAISNT